jgi:hypothetical protein
MLDRMRADDLVLVKGLRDTRATLEAWNERRWGTLAPWLIGSVSVSIGLLASTWVIAHVSSPDPTPLVLPGLGRPATFGDVLHVLYRNSLVLALHGFACVAGFIAGSSLPHTAAQLKDGLWRRIHDRAGPLAIGFVVCATTFSLITQAYSLGGGAAVLAGQLGVSPAVLLLGVAPHALPELTALFLPLAAWIIASRRGDWHQLLAATFVTVGIAIPVLVASSLVEVFVSPHLLRALAG